MQEEALHQRFEALVREREFLAHKTETLQMEKEDMVRGHTIETGELRKKNTYLQEQLQKMQDTLERTPMTHGASSSGFSDDFNLDTDFDINGDYWNDPMQMSNNDVSIKAEKIQSLHDSDKPAAAPGLLLIVCPLSLRLIYIYINSFILQLLLCGAFVASSKSSIHSLPPLPKQLQTASANVLNNIFQDAGVTSMVANRVEVADESSTSDWVVAKSAVPQMIGLDSSLAMLNAQLDGKPTTEQQHEQFMQLTPAEYNDVTSNNFLRDPEPISQRGRRHLEEGLASMRNNKGSAAEVYTRSLLWDKVDAEVVRRFAAFAARAQSDTKVKTSGEAGGYGDSAV